MTGRVGASRPGAGVRHPLQGTVGVCVGPRAGSPNLFHSHVRKVSCVLPAEGAVALGGACPAGGGTSVLVSLEHSTSTAGLCTVTRGGSTGQLALTFPAILRRHLPPRTWVMALSCGQGWTQVKNRARPSLGVQARGPWSQGCGRERDGRDELRRGLQLLPAVSCAHPVSAGRGALRGGSLTNM